MTVDPQSNVPMLGGGVKNLTGDEPRLSTPQRLKMLLEVINGADQQAKIAAIEALGEVRHPQAVETLLDGILHWDPPCWPAAEKALRQLGAYASPALLAILTDPTRPVTERTWATSWIRVLNDVSIVPVLIETLNGARADLRNAILVTLGELGDERAIPTLIAYLSDWEQAVLGRDFRRGREVAAAALEAIGTPAALQALSTWRGGSWALSSS